MECRRALQKAMERAEAALQRNGLDEAIACECTEELQQMAHRGRDWPQLRQAAAAPTEGELQMSCSAATVPTKGKPTVGDDEECHASRAQVSAFRLREAEVEAATLLARGCGVAAIGARG